MESDTPATESNASLSVRDAAALFGGDPIEKETPEAQASESVEAKANTETQADPDTQAVQDENQAQDETITIEVDGKTVEVKKSELPDLYKNGLRQADYTRKTMETAEQRKTAEAETQRARQEREHYAQGLQQAQAVLTAQLQERTQEQWNELARTDPAEWVLARNLYEQRHAAYTQNQQALHNLGERSKAEAQQAQQTYLTQQQEALLARLPEWKDEAKASAEQTAISKFLQEQGFERETIQGLTDHRMVLVARDAMRYRDMVAKAQAAAKKVSALPQRVERPGGGDSNALDGRSAAMKQLGKSGSLRDAANVLGHIFK